MMGHRRERRNEKKQSGRAGRGGQAVFELGMEGRRKPDEQKAGFEKPVPSPHEVISHK